MAFIATVHLLLDVMEESQAYDAVNEILRDQQNSFSPDSCLIDYAIHADLKPISDTMADTIVNETYSEGEFTQEIPGYLPISMI